MRDDVRPDAQDAIEPSGTSSEKDHTIERSCRTSWLRRVPVKHAWWLFTPYQLEIDGLEMEASITTVRGLVDGGAVSSGDVRPGGRVVGERHTVPPAHAHRAHRPVSRIACHPCRRLRNHPLTRKKDQ
jgi:hypothetical protein